MRLPKKFSARHKRHQRRVEAIVSAFLELQQLREELPDNQTPPGLGTAAIPDQDEDDFAEGGRAVLVGGKLTKEFIETVEEAARGDTDIREIARALLARFGAPKWQDAVKNGASIRIGETTLTVSKGKPPVSRRATNAVHHYLTDNVR